jgi:hypothetical protein
MNTEREHRPNIPHFALECVEKADPVPTWLPEGDWYRYIIGQGNTRLEGYKIGSMKSVTEYAETVAEDMNLRAVSGKSTYAANQRRPATPLANK